MPDVTQQQVVDYIKGISVLELSQLVKALEKFGVVHLIVSNAGVGGGGGPMWQIPEADWKWALDTWRGLRPA